MRNILDFYYAGPDLAGRYRPDTLDGNDLLRLQQHPILSRQTDWLVSRALKAAIRQQHTLSDGVLSHSNGCAVYLTCNVPNQIGVDLEQVKPRNFAAWHDILHADEQHWLQLHSNSPENYHVLWCLKEALIKAANGEWADLAAVGLRYRKRRWLLQAGGQTDWQGSVWLLDCFLLACVHKDAADYRFHGFGAWAEQLPQQYCTFSDGLVCFPNAAQP
ncbi:4'-phosphopantetheinyl transferase superfamily protein [Neisseria sp. ZJ106]|uniref:4'-phosphopantetheinyl transferase superfamily protein n=1 Tax=Neisseria lisongii TaxID=2912188 RepID=A0AAW5AL65_9NEIS|nr:4'-phosphopantetheinyl transferase superfamily protein [Neisseria lisongii]MCF7521111.1 4'-phosphopantetheinyl transferase superfamily protein [Neisseria lisongii]MCF7529239.1 4'-phosphopantetheinyl transferase superfamily protein [Neisseria lisongii]WCL72036.1 4'-phosphopantetheinyl transferase superfamily protein [Neisseria lisongii]